MPSTASSSASSSAKLVRWAQVAPVGVDVLPEQRDLADPVGGHRAGLGDELGRAAG